MNKWWFEQQTSIYAVQSENLSIDKQQIISYTQITIDLIQSANDNDPSQEVSWEKGAMRKRKKKMSHKW